MFCPIEALNRTKLFHVKRFCPIGGQNLTRPKTAVPHQSVRSIDFLRPFNEGDGAASVAQPVAGKHPRCKVGLNQGCHARYSGRRR